MILADAGVLLQAFRADAPEHRLCRNWLEKAAAGETRMALSTALLAAVVRAASDPRVFVRPNKPARITEFCDALLAHPNCDTIQPGPRHWRIFADLCRDTEARGATTQLAWRAALAIEWGCEWITLDRDYARFPGLRWRLPG